VLCNFWLFCRYRLCDPPVPLVSGAGAALIVLGFRIFRNRIPLACAEGKRIRSWICVADEAVDWNQIGMTSGFGFGRTVSAIDLIGYGHSKNQN